MLQSQPDSPLHVPDDRLDSWKAIATHLGRSVRTVQRWRRTAGLPVHHINNRISAVYASRQELDAWWRGQQPSGPPTARREDIPRSPQVERVFDHLEPEAAPIRTVILAGSFERPRLASGVLMLVALLAAVTIGPSPSYSSGGADGSGAREEYLRGRAFLSRPTPLDITHAIDSFERAVERDPNAAAAHAGLAQAYLRAADVVLPNATARHKSLDAINRALQLDSRTADAYVARGLLKASDAHDMSGALADFMRARTLQNQGVLARLYGGFALMALGRTADGILEIERAQREDPTNTKINARLGMTYAAFGDANRGADVCRRALALEPFAAEAHFCLGYALERGGLYDDAIGRYRTAQQLGMRAQPAIARTLARAGRRAAAYEVLDDLVERRRRGAPWPAYEAAQVYAALGDVDAAFDCLERAFDERESSLVGLIIDPELRGLHADPRFGALAERLGMRVPGDATVAPSR